MMRKLAVLAILLLPTIAEAQTYPFELTGSVGLLDGGKIRLADSQLTQGFENVNVARSDVLSLRVDWALDDTWQLEGIYAKQKSAMEDNQSFFGETPAGPVPAGDLDFLDTSVSYYHVGAIYNFEPWLQPYEIRPYAVGSAGITHIKFTQIPLDSSFNPSLSLGTGLKIGVTNRFAIRLETRLWYSVTDSGEKTTVPVTARDCTNQVPRNPCLRTYAYTSNFSQVEGSIGFTWKF